jgi:Zn-dependent protease
MRRPVLDWPRMPGIDFTQLFVVFLVLVVSLTVHEAAHAWSANQLGDPTARLLGRVSLNPAVHVDPIGTLLFPLIALVTNLPVLGWAKPVPVNTAQLGPDWKGKFMAISAAGPVSNLGLAVVAALVAQLVGPGDVDQLLRVTVNLNVFLAVFNMIPVPPLDGGNVLSGLLRGSASRAFDSLRPYGFVILYGLMFSGGLATLVGPPADLLLSWLL